MNECNLFILAWRGKDSRYNTGVLFHTPRARLRVTMYLTFWVLIYLIVLYMADTLDNP